MADLAFQYSSGGQYNAAVAAAAASAVLTGAGRLCKIVIMAQGSAVTDIYDNTAGSGTKIYTIPASGTTALPIGTVVDIQIPVANGIYVAGTTNTSGITVTYNKAGPNGN